MSDDALFVRIIDDLQTDYGIQFANDPDKEIAGQLRALESSKEKNLALIQMHLDEILVLINHKRPCIQKLAELNRDLDRQIAELQTRQSPPIRKGA